ncbi:MAG TPA: helix-hairpin-helix domain-containing protein [Syntrophales bacterium]|nr:helix-hairpin-helix domain-containing protein [Syntrophales bacterium]
MAKKINLNMAEVDDLVFELGMDRDTAEEIVRYRDEKGGFSDWDDLFSVPGMSRGLADPDLTSMIDKLKNQATL